MSSTDCSSHMLGMSNLCIVFARSFVAITWLCVPSFVPGSPECTKRITPGKPVKGPQSTVPREEAETTTHNLLKMGVQPTQHDTT